MLISFLLVQMVFQEIQVGLVNLLPTQYVYCVVTDGMIPQESEEYLQSQNVIVKKV